MRRRGELAELLSAAAAQGPGSADVLGQRAQMGSSLARYTASRMVARGELVRLSDQRPALLGLPVPDEVLDMAAPLSSFYSQTG